MSNTGKGRSQKARPKKETERVELPEDEGSELILPERVKKVLNTLPANKQSVLQQYFIQQNNYNANPLPSPETIKAFQELVPDAGERLFKQFELNGEHRRSSEKSLIRGYNGRGYLALILSGIVVLSFLAGGIWFVKLGQPIAGVATFVVAIAGVVGAVTTTKRNKSGEDKKKR